MSPKLKTRIHQRIQRVYLRLSRVFPPEDIFLQQLAKQDRPGLKISLPSIPHSFLDSLERGREAFQNQQYSEALFHFSQAISENPQSAWAWHGKGDAFQLLGDYKRSLECYKQAIQLHPKRQIHHAGKANALRGLGFEDEYQKLRLEILSLDPSLQWMLEK